MKISIQELAVIYSYITQRMLDSGIDEIELGGDYYWTICSEDREKFGETPKEPCVGSLVDDWEELQKNMRNKEITNIDLERFANLLIAISENMIKTGKIILIE